MELVSINPSLVGETENPPFKRMKFHFEDGRSFEDYQERLRRSGWNDVPEDQNIPFVPVYSLPKRYGGKHNYFAIGGNRRLFLAKPILVTMPFLVFDPNEEPSPEILGVLYRNGDDRPLFEIRLEDYLLINKPSDHIQFMRRAT